MQIQRQKYGSRYQGSRLYISIALLLFVWVLVGSGCASTKKTTKTETIVTYPNKAAAHESEQKISTSETTTTTTEAKTERPGIISSTFHAIGYVIALPFIIIGGLFRMIFGG